MLLCQDGLVDLSASVQLPAGATASFRARFEVALHEPPELALCIGYRGPNAPQELPYRLLRIARRTRVVEGPLLTAALRHTSTDRALLQLTLSPVAEDVTVNTCLLLHREWQLDTNSTHALMPASRNSTRVALLPCVRKDSDDGASASETDHDWSAPCRMLASAHTDAASGGDLTAKWPLPEFAQRCGAFVDWTRGSAVGFVFADVTGLCPI